MAHCDAAIKNTDILFVIDKKLVIPSKKRSQLCNIMCVQNIFATMRVMNDAKMDCLIVNIKLVS